MALTTLEELLQDDPRMRPDPSYAEGTVDRIESQIREAAYDLQQEEKSEPLGSEIDISSKIDRSGKPSSEEIQKMVESEDVSGLFNAYTPPVDMSKKLSQTSRMGMEAIGNALASLGGIYSARGGAPVTPLDKSGITQAANEIAKQEVQDASIKNQLNMLELQEHLNEIKAKKQNKLLKERDDARTENRIKEIQSRPDVYAGQERVARTKADIDRENIILENELRTNREAEGNAIKWAQIEANLKRANQARMSDRTASDKLNPYVYDLYDDVLGESLGTLRQLQATSLVGHILRSNPEAQKYLEENFQFGMLNYERTGELSPEIMGDIISRFWREHPQATKEMVERSKRYNDPFLLEE